MDLGSLPQTFAANRGPILATAAAGVVGLALWQRHKGAGGTPSAGDAGDSVSAGGQVAGMGGAAAYDSSSSDIYGLVQPQLESLGSQLTDLQNKLGKVPVAAPPTPPKSVVTPPKVITPPKKPAPAPPKPAPKPKPAPPHAAPKPPPVPVPAHKSAVDTWVTVNKGDSLSKIAARYTQNDITWQSIYNDNKKTVGGNPNLIHVGQRLHVTG